MPFARRKIARTGVSVTEYGFGGAPLGNLYHAITDTAAGELVRRAVAAGFRYFDTAPLYGFGLGERRLGAALHGEDVADAVISSKAGRLLEPGRDWIPERAMFIDAAPFRPRYDVSYDGVMRSYEDSLQRLGRDRVDIMLLHDIGPQTHGPDAHREVFRTAMESGYRALDELRARGDVRAVGLGVNEWQVCEAAMDHGRFDLFLLAGRYTLLEQTALDSFLPRCAREDVSVVVGGPFNSGILAVGPVPGATYNYAPAPAGILERVGAIEAVCRAHGVPLAAAALQFPLTHHSVASVIPGIGTPAELERNLALIAQPIPPALWRDLKAEGLLHPQAPVPDDEA